jgi:excisionase family DNA binding protein
MTDKQWFSIPEFAKLVGWSRIYVYKLVKARLISVARRSGPNTDYKIPRTEVVKWGLIQEDENEVDLGTL